MVYFWFNCGLYEKEVESVSYYVTAAVVRCAQIQPFYTLKPMLGLLWTFGPVVWAGRFGPRFQLVRHSEDTHITPPTLDRMFSIRSSELLRF